MFGGDVEAGPSGLGWRVIATVPVSEGAGPAADRTASAPTTVREDL
jgi:hypothetical protein